MFPSPPSSAICLRSDDVDEIGELLGGFSWSQNREQLRPGRLGWWTTMCAGSETALGWVGWRLPQLVRATPSAPLLHLPLDRRLDYRFGRRVVVATPERAIWLPAERDYASVMPPARTFGLRVSPGALTRECAALGDAGGPFREAAEIPMIGQRFRELVSLVDDLATALGGAPGEVGPPRPVHAEARLIAWLAERLVERSGAGGDVDCGLERVRRVEEWIDEHLGEPVTLARLCEVAKVGARSLQSGFRRWRGQAPLEFLRERRLAAARLRLSEAGAGESVTEIALDSGFSHLGRFSVLYRETFGESPSETLRHSPRRRGPRASFRTDRLQSAARGIEKPLVFAPIPQGSAPGDARRSAKRTAFSG